MKIDQTSADTKCDPEGHMKLLSLLKTKKGQMLLLLLYLFISNGLKMANFYMHTSLANNVMRKTVLNLIAATDLLGILLVTCYRVSKFVRKYIRIITTILAILHICLNMVLLDGDEQNYTAVSMNWIETILIICTLQHLIASIALNMLIFASIQIYTLVRTAQSPPFDIIYPFHMILLLSFLWICLYYRVNKREIPPTKTCDHSFWKKILNDHSDLVLVLRKNEEIYYVNRASQENNNTLKAVIEPYINLKGLRFKEKNIEIIHWLMRENSPENSHTVLLKPSGAHMSSEYTFEKQESGMKPQKPERSGRDSLNSRRSFLLLEDQSPSSALRRKKLKDSLKVHKNLQELIELFLSDLGRLEQITAETNTTFVGKIWNASQPDDLGEADREYSTYEIKFSVSRLENELALVIVISETTNYHMVSKLEEVTKYKNSILGSFSHVLRTPLNGILNFLTVARDSTEIAPSIVENIIKPAITCSQQLMYMINDILDYSQLSLKNFTLHFSPQEINPAVQETLQLYETEARLKGITLKYEIAEFTPLMIRTDFTRMKQILINLLKLSLNHTFSGEIVLSVNYQLGNQLLFTLTNVGIELDSETKKLLDLILIQNETNEVELTKTLNKPLGGNIGLVICSRLARLLGPKEMPVGISYKSASEKTLEFSFIIEDRPEGVDFMDIQLVSHVETANQDYLRGLILSRMNQNSLEHAAYTHVGSENFEFCDFEREALAEPVRTEPPKTSSLKPPQKISSLTTQTTKPRGSFQTNNIHSKISLQKKNSTIQSKFARSYSIPRVLCFCSCKEVLIVDDDAFNILSLGELLKSLGLSYEEAFNGDEVIQMIAKKRRCCEGCRLYSMIFMDCNMPVKDGYETTKILKKKMSEGEISFIPIIACTAYVVDYQNSKCAEVGMDDYICKPVNKTILVNILKRWEVIS